MKSQKGYSLIEIVFGIVIITLFLLTTGSLINASFANYYLILQRNEAMEIAIQKMEEVLNSDKSELIEDVFGYKSGAFEAKVSIDKVSYNDGVTEKVSDKVFKVNVEVFYSKKMRR